MPGYPDDIGHCPDLFPSISDLHSEMRGRRAARLGAALGRIDSAVDELVFRIGGLPTHEMDASDDDLEDAERIADRLEILLDGVRIPQPGRRS